MTCVSPLVLCWVVNLEPYWWLVGAAIVGGFAGWVLGIVGYEFVQTRRARR